jgi:hypothetical protein
MVERMGGRDLMERNKYAYVQKGVLFPIWLSFYGQQRQV